MRRCLGRWVHKITTDKKVMSLSLCALSLGLLLWGRLLLQDVPRTATAGDEAKKAAQADDSPRDQDPKTGSQKKSEPILFIDPTALPQRELIGTYPNRYRHISLTPYAQAGPKSLEIIPDVDTRMAVVRRQAMGLHLKSVVIGNRPGAYINERLLALGKEYEGFKLIHVTEDYVLLTKNGLIVRLEM